MVKISRPTLLIDKRRCLANLRKMSEKATRSGCIFRPHFKTHQNVHVGEWFRDHGVKEITVSSVEMAAYFADGGWDDITIAFPVNVNEINRINKLAAGIKLGLLVESMDAIAFLHKHIQHPITVFIEIDTGHHRSGIPHDNTSLIDDMTTRLSASERLTFSGFLTHSGQTYHAGSRSEVTGIFNDVKEIMLNLKSRYKEIFPGAIISLGDTPSCSVIDDFSEIDELRPGNFIYYDLMQESIGSCSIDDIAVCLACPVVAKNEDASEIVIYGGAVHLSKEFLDHKANGRHYGQVTRVFDNGWGMPVEGTCVKSLSQEHGIIQTTPELMHTFKRGDIVGILPVHSCLTAHLSGSHYIVLD